MRKRRALWIVIVVAIVVAMAAQPALAKKAIKWKAQSAWPSGLLGQKAFEDFCQ